MKRRRIALGIHLGHDRGVAIVRDGLLVGQLAQERIDRRKHSPSPEIPYQALDKLLRYLDLKPSDIGAVGFSYTNVRVEDAAKQFTDELRDHYKVRRWPIYPARHHDCHALATFYTSGFTETLILVADGAGDIVGQRLEAETLYRASVGEIRPIAQRLQHFGLTRTDRRNAFNYDYMHEVDRVKQISIGRKYEQITYLLGFSHGESGKTMGLASYGKSLFDFADIDVHDFNFSLTFADLLNDIAKLQQKSGLPFYRFVRERRADLAATVQLLAERHIVTLLRNINPIGKQRFLCLAGGLFLNCLLNHRILEQTRFERIHIFPAAGDDGQAVGAALHAYQEEFGAPCSSSETLPYLGIAYDKSTIRKALCDFDVRHSYLPHAELAERTASYLAAGATVGLFRGRSEVGPRALCHRSILADPRRKSMRDHLNRRVKYRESFRPFGPVVTEEDQFRFFELKQESPFMLLAANVRPEYHRRLAAITHVDGTARPQAVSRKKDAFVHALLRAFERRTGYPVLLNTSFNLNDEPIVETPRDALSTFLRSRLDVLVLENALIVKPTSPEPSNQ